MPRMLQSTRTTRSRYPTPAPARDGHRAATATAAGELTGVLSRIDQNIPIASLKQYFTGSLVVGLRLRTYLSRYTRGADSKVGG